MKINELTIGDWVRAGNSFPMQVVGLFKDVAYLDFEGNEADMWEEKEEDIEPIPITPEILEKNGFEKNVSPYVTSLFDWESEDGRIVINHLSNMVGRDWSIHIDNEDYQTIGSADIKHVHELQHALRLCDVNKEIIIR